MVFDLIKTGMSGSVSSIAKGALIALPLSALIALGLASLGYLIPIGIFVVIAVQLLAGGGRLA